MTYHLEGKAGGMDLFRRIKEGSQPVILFGFSSFAKDLLFFFQMKGYPVQIMELWDNVKQGVSWNGLTVTAPHALTGEPLPVVICSYTFEEELRVQALELGCRVILSHEGFYYGETFSYEEYRQCIRPINWARAHQWERENETGMFLPSVDYLITDRCDLRCRDCANLMQFFSDARDFDFDRNRSAFIGLLNAVDYIAEVRILGGEPFLNRELADYLEFLKPVEKIGLLIISTNGTLLPDGRTLNLLKDPHILVNISQYGGLSRRIPELEQLFRENEILFTVTDMAERGWFPCSRIYEQKLDQHALIEKFAGCGTHMGYTFRLGKFFPCVFAANAQALHAIPFSDADFAEISTDSSEEDRENLAAFLKRAFIPACNYCEQRTAEDYLVPPAIQSPTVLPYFRYD